MSATNEAIKQSVQLWLASVLRSSLVAAAAWLSAAHPEAARILAIPPAVFPWIATCASVAVVSGVSAWLSTRRHSEAVTAAYRDGIQAAEMVAVAAERGGK